MGYFNACGESKQGVSGLVKNIVKAGDIPLCSQQSGESGCWWLANINTAPEIVAETLDLAGIFQIVPYSVCVCVCHTDNYLCTQQVQLQKSYIIPMCRAKS